MVESLIVQNHDMEESSMVRDHDMWESSIVWDDLADNQIVVLPEHLQHPEGQPTPNGTPYWVPDVLEDEKPKEGPTRAHRLKADLVGGYDKVLGTSTDYCNFKRCVNSFIGDRDAQMLVDKMCKRKAFLKTHKKQPPFAVTDQDGALRNAVVKMFLDSHHRLCMWHITEKLPGKVPMCGLMKTTSRSESSNTFFQIYSHEGNTLVQFMLCFESAMEKQRYTQRVLENASNGPTPTILTELPFEKHASDVYTPFVFKEVVLNKKDSSVTCSCGHYNQHGFLCRHVFCVFRIFGIHKIPDVYINRRWTKNVLPTYLLDKRHRYGPCIEETDTLASQVHQTIEECIGLFRNDTAKLSELLSTIQDLKKKLENKMQRPHVELNKQREGKNVVVDDEDEGDTDDQFDDEALCDTEDEFDEDDEINDEFSSDEE
nr:protein FAR1-related sequence 5-like [Tanacetum cinerariifolium]